MASEYLKWKYRDVHPEKPVELTKKQRRQNWWYYHKWHVGLVLLLLLVGADLVRHAVTQVQPDYQIAYVSSYPLCEEDAAAWEARLARLGTDCNGDGRVVVRLNQYPTGGSSGDVMYAAAENVRLMADLDGCESYFFLLEDPEGFQADYELLRAGWLPTQGGLFLARRDFWGDRTAGHREACDALWDALKEEAAT